MSNDMRIDSGVNIGLDGRYCVKVVDSATKEVVSDYGWKKNLILNPGMDIIPFIQTADCFAYGVIGLGARPNSITSSTSTISQSGNFISLVNNSFLTSFTQSYWDAYGTQSYTSSVNKGDVIVDQDLSQSTVLSVVSGSLLFVDSNYTYTTPKTFTIWKTSQGGLQNEIHRSSTYFQGSSSVVGFNCGTVWSGSIVSMRRTWDFSTETITRSYNEIGTSWTGVSGTNCFSRVTLPSPVVIAPGQQVRLSYELTTSWGPTYPVYRTASITGWPVPPSTTVTCTESIQNLLVTAVHTNGSSYPLPYIMFGTNNVFCSLEPAVGGLGDSFGTNGWCLFGSEDSQSLSPFLTASARATNVGLANHGGLDTYVAGTFSRTKTATFDIYTLNSSNIRSIGFGCFYAYQFGVLSYPYNPNYQAVCMLFDQPQTKTGTQTLTLTWNFNWSRVLA